QCRILLQRERLDRRSQTHIPPFLPNITRAPPLSEWLRRWIGNVRTMSLLVARCEIAYHGRAVTRLGAGDRVILFKTDGSLCVHGDQGVQPAHQQDSPTT